MRRWDSPTDCAHTCIRYRQDVRRAVTSRLTSARSRSDSPPGASHRRSSPSAKTGDRRQIANARCRPRSLSGVHHSRRCVVDPGRMLRAGWHIVRGHEIYITGRAASSDIKRTAHPARRSHMIDFGVGISPWDDRKALLCAQQAKCGTALAAARVRSGPQSARRGTAQHQSGEDAETAFRYQSGAR